MLHLRLLYLLPFILFPSSPSLPSLPSLTTPLFLLLLILFFRLLPSLLTPLPPHPLPSLNTLKNSHTHTLPVLYLITGAAVVSRLFPGGSAQQLGVLSGQNTPIPSRISHPCHPFHSVPCSILPCPAAL
jgi:hypothetical protein